MDVERDPERFGNGEALRERLWRELVRTSVDRHHDWRTPVLATVDAGGLPQARTVVLREVRPASEQLLIYTDARSPKVGELLAQPHATLLCWSAQLHWQLRLQLSVTVLREGYETQHAWERVKQSPSAGDYLAARAPGEPLAAGPEAELSEPQLAVLVGRVLSMDWLELGRAGHRRARLDAQVVQWLVP